jgi:hypothetical protein
MAALARGLQLPSRALMGASGMSTKRRLQLLGTPSSSIQRLPHGWVRSSSRVICSSAINRSVMAVS